MDSRFNDDTYDDTYICVTRVVVAGEGTVVLIMEWEPGVTTSYYGGNTDEGHTCLCIITN